jgi:proline iminopeptidase
MKRLSILCGLLLVLLLHTPGYCSESQPREGFVRAADGVRLFYRVVGSGPETLVAVHGGPGNSLESILPDMEPLAKGRRVIYYDQRGNGRSDLLKERDKLAISKHVADLEAVRAHFKLERMTLLGNSWGGLLVGFYAAAHPDRVERMVLHAPAPPTRALINEMNDEIRRRMGERYDDAQRKRFAFVSDPRTWLKADDPRAVCREWARTLLAVYVSRPESMKQFKGDVCAGSEEAVRYQRLVNSQIWSALGDWNLTSSLIAVKAPVLVVHGEADVIPVRASEAWARAMPNARLLLIKGAGHIPQVEQPEIFFNAVETFLKGGWAPEARKAQSPAGKW